MIFLITSTRKFKLKLTPRLTKLTIERDFKTEKKTFLLRHSGSCVVGSMRIADGQFSCCLFDLQILSKNINKQHTVSGIDPQICLALYRQTMCLSYKNCTAF